MLKSIKIHLYMKSNNYKMKVNIYQIVKYR